MSPTATVPPPVQKPQTVEVKIQADNKSVAGHAILTLYPYPSATIDDITPKQINLDTKSEQQSSDNDSDTGSMQRIKVSGTNFFAPHDQINVRFRSVESVARFARVESVVDSVDPDGKGFTALVRDIQDTRAGTERAGDFLPVVTVWGQPVRPGPTVKEENLRVKISRTVPWLLPAVLSLVVCLVLAAIIVVLYQMSLVQLPATDKPKWYAALFYEPQNQTYSLSRFQFFWWLSIILFAYMFLFFARGLIEDTWVYISLSGFAYTFLISLVTLVGAQATNVTKGVKGAGEVYPAVSDLIMNGGVLAPERVQQLVWTVVAGIGLVVITIKTYATAAALPSIPTELLALMGISAAGYLGGKVTRAPGPVVDQTLVVNGSLSLRIYGTNLSVPTDVSIQIDDKDLDKAAVPPDLSEIDPTNGRFAKVLTVKVPAAFGGDQTADQWVKGHHKVTVINNDGQRAVSPPPKLPTALTITNVQFSPPDSQGQTVVTVIGQSIAPGATLAIRDVPDVQWKQDPTKPDSFTASVPANSPWLTQAQTFVLTNPGGQTVAYPWHPPAAHP
jgi:hypothetical protein